MRVGEPQALPEQSSEISTADAFRAAGNAASIFTRSFLASSSFCLFAIVFAVTDCSNSVGPLTSSISTSFESVTFGIRLS